MYKIVCVSLLLMIVLAVSSCGEAKKPKNKVRKQASKVLKSEKKDESPAKNLSEAKVEKSMTSEQISKANEILANVSSDKVEAVDAKKLFRMHCAACHGFKGNMKVNGAKDLTVSKLPQDESVAQMYFGKGLMTPYKNILKEHEIVALSEFITTLR